jgi:hypothetical protein
MIMTETKLITIPKFAKMCGISTYLARELVRRRDIPSVQVGPRRRINIQFVERWTAGGLCEQPASKRAALERL